MKNEDPIINPDKEGVKKVKWYIMAIRRGDEFVLDTRAYNQYEFPREYESVANRIGSENIRVFTEVHARTNVSCILPE